MTTRLPPDDPAWAAIRERTHAFQNIRPLHPAANARCAYCDMALPHGPMIVFDLVPCARTPRADHNG